MAAPLSSGGANSNRLLETDAGVLARYFVGQREELGLEPFPSSAFGALVIAAFKIEKVVAVVLPSGLHAWVEWCLGLWRARAHGSHPPPG
jgi:hypothetical protein